MNTRCDDNLSATRDWLARISWREALSGLGRHASGLHRYRELRARALEDALAGEDCRAGRGRD